MSVNREWLEKDYYAVLGVPKNAGQADIKKAYRKLAQQHHPDANRGNKQAEERFKEISAAYDVVGDVDKRAEYDRIREMGAGGFRFGPGGPGPGGVRFEDLGFEGGLGGIFGDLFGGGAARRAPARGADLVTEVSISFEDSMRGLTLPVRVSGAAPCETCGGSGARPGTPVNTCSECGGRGTVAVDQGLFSLARACPRCGGAGRVIESPCSTCGGSGHTRATRELKVRIPAGIDDGARIRLSGRGEPAGAGRPGDLFVVVRVDPHRFFGRRGPNLTLTLPVTYPEAALGAKVPVPTLNGSVTLKVPAGTESGKTFRIRGRGIPNRGGGTGDLLVTVKVTVPARLSRQQKDLLKQLRESNGESPRAYLGVEGEVKP